MSNGTLPMQLKTTPSTSANTAAALAAAAAAAAAVTPTTKTTPTPVAVAMSNETKELDITDSNCDFSFELTPKRKLTCIPENVALLRMMEPKDDQGSKAEVDKSWSVLFIGSKASVKPKDLRM